VNAGAGNNHFTHKDGGYSFGDNAAGGYAGVGAGFNFARSRSVGGNYHYCRMSKPGTSVDDSMFTVSLEYSF